MSAAVDLLARYGIDTPGRRDILGQLAGYGWSDDALYAVARQFVLFAQRAGEVTS